jgi:hypothetical protein
VDEFVAMKHKSNVTETENGKSAMFSSISIHVSEACFFVGNSAKPLRITVLLKSVCIRQSGFLKETGGCRN